MSKGEDDAVQRGRRLAVLGRAGCGELDAWHERLSPPPSYRLLRSPETGLVMVRGRAGGDGATFNLGEMTVSRCSLLLPDGRVGYSYVAGRDLRRAELVALFDALLQGKGCRDLDGMIDGLAARQSQEQVQTAREVGATKVDFFTLARGDE